MTSKEVGLGFGILGIVFSIWSCYKVKRANDVIDISLEQLSDNIDVDVESLITEKAIERSLDRSVDRKVSEISRSIVRRIEDDIHGQVRGAITTSYTDIKKSVENEVGRQVAKIDIDSLKKDARNDAKKLILEKFEGNLDDILSDFNRNLEQVGKIYGSIANTLNPKN